jgi:hypothetical protein
MKRPSIPDLHADNEITLEHCYILVERLGKGFDALEGTNGFYKHIADLVNPARIKEFYDSFLEPPAFSRLFQTEFGKGVLIGMFMQNLNGLIDQQNGLE